jgi:fatty-acyl-CoA synthase
MQAGRNLPRRRPAAFGEEVMPAEKMAAASSAYTYPLLIKQLLHTPMALAADQEIVYRDQVRYRYRDFRDRIGRLANVLAGLDVKQGDVVAVMDWDSHRYLECYFAVPMMGVTLMTVNVRLNPQQISYCLNHAKATLLLVHRDFLPVLEQFRSQIPALNRFILIGDGGDGPPPAGFAGEYESLLAEAGTAYDFRSSTRTPLARRSTTGTTASRRQSPSATARSCCTPWAAG